MKIRVDKFCSLSTSPSWQAWLFHLDVGLYRRFMKQLQEARGCDRNREVMVELLKEIDQLPVGTEKLFEFLAKHYPTMLTSDDGVNQRRAPVPVKDAAVFPDYNPDLLTYPRRRIFEGDEAERQAREFLLDKLKSDLAVVDGKAYVEYLGRGDAILADKIPTKNWLIAAWRLRNMS